MYWEDLVPAARPSDRVFAATALAKFVDRYRDATSAMARWIQDGA